MSSKANELREALARKKQALELRKSQRGSTTTTTTTSSSVLPSPRQDSVSAHIVDNSGSGNVPPKPQSSPLQKSEIDDLLQNVLSQSSASAAKTSTGQSTPAVDQPSSISETSTTNTTTSVENVKEEMLKKRKSNLVLAPMDDMTVDIAPRDYYSKSVQTTIENIEIPILVQHTAEHGAASSSVLMNNSYLSHRDGDSDDDDESVNRSINSSSVEIGVDDTDFLQEKQRMEDRERNAEDVQRHAEEQYHSLSFGKFFRNASLYIERCLNQPYDPLIDYTASLNRANISDTKKIHLEKVFYDETWCKGKSVTGIACSPKHKELFLVTYYSPDDGLILQWNRNLPNRYEQRLECETPVSTVKYNKYDPNIIIGGTYSGQILVWDSREKPTPIQRSTINSLCHTQPIFGLELHGSTQLDQIITMSTDGRICIWNPKNLSKPFETVELYSPVENNTEKSIMTYAMAFQPGESNKCFIGGENGKLYSTHLLGSNSGIEHTYRGHHAPVTAIHAHPMPEFGDLILTSSMDWSCKLWSHKYRRPLLSIDEFKDYVYDIKWSPTHPAMFASVDGSGCLSIWNMNKDLDLPMLSEQVCDNPLNKLQWMPDGRSILTGSATGHVHMYKLDEDVAVPKQVYDEAQMLKKVRQELIASYMETYDGNVE